MKEHSPHHANPADQTDIDKKMFVLIFIATVILMLVFLFWPKETASQLTPRAAFAACLSSKGITMYGEDTCPNCQLQKGMFEEDFSHIHYINCLIHQDECSQLGIQGYPMWMYNGQSFPGIQTFQNLAQISGCQAP